MFTGDDVSLTDKWGLPQLTAEVALESSIAGLRQAGLFTQPLTFCFHPHYFSGTQPSSIPWVSGLAEYARAEGAPAYNVGEWLGFWQARSGVALTHAVVRDTLSLGASHQAPSLGLAVPRRWRGKLCQERGVLVAATDEVLLPLAGAQSVRYG